ncbi:hypothetical protein HK28_08420 [Acetobacter sp. DsW_063]|nr:hypothetical protein HK28_08420 [Acetobacter sp. DsW_063]
MLIMIRNIELFVFISVVIINIFIAFFLKKFRFYEKYNVKFRIIISISIFIFFYILLILFVYFMKHSHFDIF